MASLDPSNSPSPPSFSRNESAYKFLRSVSTNEQHSFSELPCTPPRLSSASLSGTSSLSSPFRSFSPTTKLSSSLETAYQCLSSVLKNDGQILSIAMANGLIYTGSESNVIRIWKLPGFKECGQLKTNARTVVALVVSSDRVYAAYADCKIRVWQRKCNGELRHERLATIPKTGGSVRSYITGKDKMAKHMGPITCLAVNILDDILYSASVDKTVKAWSISDFSCIETFQAHSEPINAIIVGSDGVLYTGSDDATIRVWRRSFGSANQSHSLVLTLPAKNSPVKALSLTPDNKVLYGGCTDGYLHFWLKGWFSGQLQYGGSLQGHTHAVMCLASVANYVISGSADLTSRVWIREREGRHTCLAVMVGHRGPLKCVTAITGRIGEESDEDGCTVCTGSLDGVIKVWHIARTSEATKPLAQNHQDYFDLKGLS